MRLFGGPFCRLRFPHVAGFLSAPKFAIARPGATLGAGTAVGGVLGDKIGGTTGALVGGAVGLAGTALVSNAIHSSATQASAEAAEAARREERLKILQDYWNDKTLSAQADAATGAQAPAPLEYPAGTYSGIRFAPRLAADSSLSEPIR
jgi:hypothetical protein